MKLMCDLLHTCHDLAVPSGGHISEQIGSQFSVNGPTYPRNGYLGCFQFSVIMKSAIMICSVHIIFIVLLGLSLGKIPRCKLPMQRVNE